MTNKFFFFKKETKKIIADDDKPEQGLSQRRPGTVAGKREKFNFLGKEIAKRFGRKAGFAIKCENPNIWINVSFMREM